MTLIENLLNLQIPEDIKISPNCQQVLYATKLPLQHKTGERLLSTIWLAQTGKENSARQLTSGLFNDHSPRWCPDDNSIAFVSDRAKQGESSAIYVLPTATGGEAHPLTPAENERDIEHLEFSPDGTTIAFTSADEKTEEMKKKDKEKDDVNVWGEDWPFNRIRLVKVATREVTTLVSRAANVDAFCWNDDGTKIAIAETRTPNIESQFIHGNTFSTVDVSSKAMQEVCSFPQDIGNLIWVGNDLYFIGNVNEHSTISATMVRRIDLSAKELTYEKYAHGEDDCAMSLVKAGKDVIVGVEHGMEDQIRMLKGNTLFSERKSVDDWDAQFTNDSDELIIAVTFGDTNRSPEVYTRTASGGALVQLSGHGSALKDRQLAKVNFLSCQSACQSTGQSADDKVRLDSLFLTPSSQATSDGKPDRPLPTVVLIHGGPYSRNTDQFNPLYHMWSPVLLDAGYGVLITNYRGNSGRGEDFAACARGGCGTVDYDDIVTLTQNAIDKGYADKEKLVVAGWSQGGFLSFLCAVRNGLHGNGWKFQAAIPGAGVADADSMCFTSDLGVFQADLQGKAPWSVSDITDVSARRGSPIWEFAAAVEKGDVIPPMLILHGEKDERVPIEQSRAFRRGLESAQLPFEFVTYPREPHLFKERKHIVDMAGRVVRFVDKYIGAE